MDLLRAKTTIFEKIVHKSNFLPLAYWSILNSLKRKEKIGNKLNGSYPVSPFSAGFSLYILTLGHLKNRTSIYNKTG